MELDLVSRLHHGELHHILKHIFLPLSPDQLAASRSVCKSWRDYLQQVFWKEKGCRGELLRRLDKRWREERHRRVEVRVDGLGDQFEIQDGCVVLHHPRSTFVAHYLVNEAAERPYKFQFEKPQFQIRLDLSQDLALQTQTFLSRPVFHKKKTVRRKVRTKDLTIEVDEMDPTLLIIGGREDQKEITKFKPYTGWGEAQPIQEIATSCGRLAVLVKGRVFVFSLQGLLDRTSSGSQEHLLLVATRQHQPAVVSFKLDRQRLITIGGGTIVTFNFWTDQLSAMSEFFQ